jgi:GNAT superfamily N-acetyltransferase
VIDVELLNQDAADDTDLVDTVVRVVNRAYTTAEAQLWRRPLPRTNADEVRAAIRVGETAVARLDGVIVGSLFVRMLDADTGWFGALGVDPTVGGRGIGGRLVAFAERRAITLGASEMQIEVLLPTTAAAYSERLSGWYGLLGYRPVSSRELVDFDPDSVADALVDIRVVTMRKRLS